MRDTLRIVETPRCPGTVTQLLAELWGGDFVVSRGQVYPIASLSSLMVYRDDELVGILTYRQADLSFEVLTLNALIERNGVGSLLLNHLLKLASAEQIPRVWLITTNDNLRALGFYMRRGFRVVAIHREGINEARRIKPSIPFRGEFNIPIMDEIELEVLM